MRPDQLRFLKKLFSNYKAKAARRGLSWKLEFGEFRELSKQTCAYCGTAPLQSYGSYRYNGVDRLDSRRGYIPLNCVSCCKVCNCAKKTLTFAEFSRAIFSVQPPVHTYLETGKVDLRPVMRRLEYTLRFYAQAFEWKLDFEDFSRLVTSPCAYTGAKPSKVFSYNGAEVRHNLIARHDSRSGFAVANCAPCSPTVAQLKGGRTDTKFMRWIFRVQSCLDACS